MALIHKPWQPTPDTPDLKGENREPHLKANVEYADKIVGRIVSELDALGIRENTLVLFIGDNGTQGAGKSTPTEWGARVPFIVNAPGVISGGQVSRELSDISDVLPTMLDFAGAPQPADITLDGVSLAPYLTGASENHREFIFSFLGHYRILRDRQWLLEQNTEENFGQMYYCGESRDGRGYEDVTGSAEPGALAARERFEQRLKELPVPVTTPEARREFEAQTAPKIETLNRHLQKLDPGIRQRSVPVVARKKGQRSLADKEEED